MCGILGVCHFDKQPVNVKSFHQGASVIRHRGPDDEGYLLMDLHSHELSLCSGADSDPQLNLPPISDQYDRPFSLALGFRRLSILDLSTSGHQPMPSKDGRYWIIFNGEIYNYVELRDELKKLGYEFSSTSDTEVLLTGYSHWGCELLNKLVGMFAFAVLDLNQRRLFLARDFFGIKPLYYTLRDNRFAFASEAKALLEMENVERAIDPNAAYLYLRHGLTDHDETSLWRDIRKLPAAHFMDISLDSPGSIQPQRYWSLVFNQHLRITFSEAAAQLRELFLQNIRLHLRSDVPVGSALSGGIDSSSIVSAIRRVQAHEQKLLTFSYLADDPAWNEEKWVDLVGKHVEARVHKVAFSATSLASDLDQLIYSLDEPFGGTSIYAQYCVFRLAHQQNIKVMLDGQGADELMGGYGFYLSGRLLSLFASGRWWRMVPFVRKVWNHSDSDGPRMVLRAAGLLVPPSLHEVGHHLAGRDLFPGWMRAPWFQDRGVAGRAVISLSEMNPRQALRGLLQQTFTLTSLPMLLRYEDRNSMAHSIESRVPFLTPDLVNFIFALPEEYILNDEGLSKSVFRQAMRGIVPDAILDRRDKIGFATSESHLLHMLRPWIEDIFKSNTAREIPLLNLPQIETEYHEILAGKRKYDSHVWRWINFIRWAGIFKVTY